MIGSFQRPATVVEAVRLRAELGDAAAFIAGGTEINSNDSESPPENLISLADLPLDVIDNAPDALIIGSGCTLQSLIDGERIWECLREAARGAPSRGVRNMATLGGHVAGRQACPALTPLLVALEADVEIVGIDSADAVAIVDYLAGDQRPLITHFRLPKHKHRRHVALERYARSAIDDAVITVAVSLSEDCGHILNPIIAIAGLNGRPVTRLMRTENRLHNQRPPSQDELSQWIAEEVEPQSDHRGDVVFKRRLAAALAARAVINAHGGEGYTL